MIVPATIQKQYEQAKATLPGGFTYKGVPAYRITETLSSGNGVLDRRRKLGEVKATFSINVTEDGKETIQSAGKSVEQYYTADFEVQSDGSVVLVE